MLHMTGKQIAAEVRAVIARRRISHRELAEKIGLTPSQFSRRLSGQIEFTGSEIAAMAHVLDVDAGVFFHTWTAVAV